MHILWRVLRVPEYKIATLVFTTENNIQYFDQCLKSTYSPIVIFDGVDAIRSDNYSYLQCNSGRPSVAKNFGLSKIDLAHTDFIQLLDADDFLNLNYYDEISQIIKVNDDYNLFFCDYSIINEDFNFTNREYLTSLCSDHKRDNVLKIKNPLIRSSVFSKLRFNDDMTHFELIDLIVKIGIENCYHIPKDLQNVRIHAKSNVRLVRKEEAQRSFNLIDWKNNG